MPATSIRCGFEKGKSSPCVFFHRLKKISVFVHGDDFATTGKIEDAKWLVKNVPAIQKTYIVENFNHFEFNKFSINKTEGFNFQKDFFREVSFFHPVEIYVSSNATLFENRSFDREDHKNTNSIFTWFIPFFNVFAICFILIFVVCGLCILNHMIFKKSKKPKPP